MKKDKLNNLKKVNILNEERYINDKVEVKPSIDENTPTWTQNMKTKSFEFAKDVWNSIKREGKETKMAVKILNNMMKGDTVTDDEKLFLKAQSKDLIKILPLVAIQGIPIPIPITPILLYVSKKYNIPIFPDSHKVMPLDKINKKKED